jgi:hypothetical protein
MSRTESHRSYNASGTQFRSYYGPAAGSTSDALVHTDQDNRDAFIGLLERLAEHEVSRGGPSELDLFLSGQIR